MRERVCGGGGEGGGGTGERGVEARGEGVHIVTWRWADTHLYIVYVCIWFTGVTDFVLVCTSITGSDNVVFPSAMRFRNVFRWRISEALS